MKLRLISLVGTCFVMSACSSTSNRSVEVPALAEPIDYVVRERNPDPTPDWARDFSAFKKSSEGKGDFYFLGESGDVNDRIAGCSVANMNAKKKIAQQIAQLISNKLAEDKQGRLSIDPNDSSDPGMKRAFEEQIAAKSVAFLTGVREQGQFWELRDYSRSNGHRRVFNCSTLVAISDKDLRLAIKRSSQKTTEIVEDADAKAAVSQALNGIEKEYSEYVKASNQ